jgi:hypothetical protein
MFSLFANEGDITKITEEIVDIFHRYVIFHLKGQDLIFYRSLIFNLNIFNYWLLAMPYFLTFLFRIQQGVYINLDTSIYLLLLHDFMHLFIVCFGYELL